MTTISRDVRPQAFTQTQPVTTPVAQPATPVTTSTPAAPAPAVFDKAAGAPFELNAVTTGVQQAFPGVTRAGTSSVMGALMESKKGGPKVDVPFGDIHLKDAALNRMLHGFSGVTTLEPQHIEKLLGSARDGKGFSASEKKDLTRVFDSGKLSLDAKVMLANALGISFSPVGLDKAPMGTTDIALWDPSLLHSNKQLQFKKDADGTMQVSVRPQLYGDVGWIPVKADGTFSFHKAKPAETRDSSGHEWDIQGKVSFANGAFTADVNARETVHSTRPEGSQDTPYWNSGNRIPVVHTYEQPFITDNHPSLNGARAFHATLSSSGSSSQGTAVVARQTADGVVLQLDRSPVYGGTIPMKADGTIDHQAGSIHWKGKLEGGHLSLSVRNQVTPGYAEGLSWSGSMPDLQAALNAR